MKLQIIFIECDHNYGISVDTLAESPKLNERARETLGIWSTTLHKPVPLYSWVVLPEVGIPFPVSMYVIDHEPKHDAKEGIGYARTATEAFGIVLCDRKAYETFVHNAAMESDALADKSPDAYERLWMKAEQLSPTHPFRWFNEHTTIEQPDADLEEGGDDDEDLY